VSGAKDLVVNKGILQSSELGHSMMSRITGMGCLFCSIIAAFYAIEDDPLIASFQATQFFGFAGKITAENPAAVGPASFKTAFIDALYNLQ
jgi:hydroxyethylthiazole kinase